MERNLKFHTQFSTQLFLSFNVCYFYEMFVWPVALLADWFRCCALFIFAKKNQQHRRVVVNDNNSFAEWKKNSRAWRNGSGPLKLRKFLIFFWNFRIFMTWRAELSSRGMLFGLVMLTLLEESEKERLKLLWWWDCSVKKYVCQRNLVKKKKRCEREEKKFKLKKNFLFTVSHIQTRERSSIDDEF